MLKNNRGKLGFAFGVVAALGGINTVYADSSTMPQPAKLILRQAIKD